MIYAVLFIIAIAAFGLSAVCGGGASFLLLPALGLALPATQVPAALSIGTAFSSVSRIIIFRKHIRWDIVAWFVPFSLPAVWFGVSLLSHINPVWLELVIGIFLVINLPFIFKKEKPTKLRNPRWLLAVIGVATGFISGLTGAVGLLFNRFYLTYGLTKDEIIATRAANELLLHLVKIVLYGAYGLLTLHSVGAGAILAVAAILSAWLMKKLLQYISETGFRRTGFIAMVLSGVVMLFSSCSTLYHKEQVRLGLTRIDDGLEARLRTRQSHYVLEVVFDEGIEIERKISFGQLPPDRQAKTLALAKGATVLLIEEVHGWGRHGYELYLKDINGQTVKHDL